MPVWLIAVATTVGSVLGKTLISMGSRLLTEQAAEWAVRWGAKKIVDSTETKADNEWQEKIEKLLGDGLAKP